MSSATIWIPDKDLPISWLRSDGKIVRPPKTETSSSGRRTRIIGTKKSWAARDTLYTIRNLVKAEATDAGLALIQELDGDGLEPERVSLGTERPTLTVMTNPAHSEWRPQWRDSNDHPRWIFESVDHPSITAAIDIKMIDRVSPNYGVREPLRTVAVELTTSLVLWGGSPSRSINLWGHGGRSVTHPETMAAIATTRALSFTEDDGPTPKTSEGMLREALVSSVDAELWDLVVLHAPETIRGASAPIAVPVGTFPKDHTLHGASPHTLSQPREFLSADRDALIESIRLIRRMDQVEEIMIPNPITMVGFENSVDGSNDMWMRMRLRETNVSQDTIDEMAAYTDSMNGLKRVMEAWKALHQELRSVGVVVSDLKESEILAAIANPDEPVMVKSSVPTWRTARSDDGHGFHRGESSDKRISTSHVLRHDYGGHQAHISLGDGRIVISCAKADAEIETGQWVAQEWAEAKAIASITGESDALTAFAAARLEEATREANKTAMNASRVGAKRRQDS